VDPSKRDARLKREHEGLQALQQSSSIFRFETTGDPPDRYTLTFRGKGLGRDPSSQSEVTAIDLHQVDLRLPYSYPQSPPDIRWLTPIFHPNISFSGFVNLADIGLVWAKDVTLDVVCERLWDMARLEFVNAGRATNYSAKNWLEKNDKYRLPVDARPLRDRAAGGGTNVVRYERRAAGRGVQLAGAAVASGEVVFIDENTPTPAMPQRRPYVPVGRRRPRSDDDVMYIGPE
jgi:ubiquitin-protein ligase